MAGNRNSGRRRKSSELHLLQGTYRADRHHDRATPDPPKGRPDTPATLTGVAAAEWHRMIHRLEVMQTLAGVDDAVLEQYCQLYAETDTLRIEASRLATLGKTLRKALKGVEGEALVELVGKIVALEQLRARTLDKLRAGHLAIRQYLVELGMTPSARTRVKALAAKGDPTPQDQLRARFFGAKTPA